MLLLAFVLFLLLLRVYTFWMKWFSLTHSHSTWYRGLNELFEWFYWHLCFWMLLLAFMLFLLLLGWIPSGWNGSLSLNFFIKKVIIHVLFQIRMLWYQSEWENHRIVLNGLCALSYGLGAPKKKEKVEAKWPCPYNYIIPTLMTCLH